MHGLHKRRARNLSKLASARLKCPDDATRECLERWLRAWLPNAAATVCPDLIVKIEAAVFMNDIAGADDRARR
jgi:hypothetical protein